MDMFHKVLLIAGIVIFVIIVLAIILAIKNDKVTDQGVLWTDKKHTIFGLPISLTRYVLTSRKLVTRTGFLTITEDEISLYRVTDKRLEMSLFERLFGCGTIILNVANDADDPIKEIKGVKNPRSVSKQIEELIEEERKKYNLNGQEMAATDAGMIRGIFVMQGNDGSEGVVVGTDNSSNKTEDDLLDTGRQIKRNYNKKTGKRVTRRAKKMFKDDN